MAMDLFTGVARPNLDRGNGTRADGGQGSAFAAPALVRRGARFQLRGAAVWSGDAALDCAGGAWRRIGQGSRADDNTEQRLEAAARLQKGVGASVGQGDRL